MTRLVRPATVDDLDAIADLGHAAIDLGDYPDATHGDVERNLAALRAEPDAAFVAHEAVDFDPGDVILVAPADKPERAVAFCRARLCPDDEQPYGEVKLIGVLPVWRGRGLGRALLRWGIRRLQGRGVPTIALAVSAANEHALRLYEAHGFRRSVEWPQWRRDA